MQLKSFATEFKSLEKNEFEGFAATFGNKDAGGDIIEPGAFAKTLQEGAKRVKVLWQHDIYSPIGKPVEMKEESRGLYVRAKIADTTLGRDALELMREGVINELSIGYDSIKESYDNESSTRHLLELKLWEFSPVTFAMSDLAVITGAKSISDLEPLLKRAHFLAENGLKAGRVLSKQNLALVKEAYEALGALLETAEGDGEPEKSTHGTLEAKGAAQADTEPHMHSVEALIGEIKALGALGAEQTLLRELRDFSRSLRSN